MVQSTDYRPNLGSQPGTQISSINYGLPSTVSLWPAAKKSAKGNKLARTCVEEGSPGKVRSRLLYLHYQDTSQSPGLLLHFSFLIFPILLSLLFVLPSESPFSLIPFLYSSIASLYLLPLSFTSPCFQFSLVLLFLKKRLSPTVVHMPVVVTKVKKQDTSTYRSQTYQELFLDLLSGFSENFHHILKEHSSEREVANPR